MFHAFRCRLFFFYLALLIIPFFAQGNPSDNDLEAPLYRPSGSTELSTEDGSIEIITADSSRPPSYFSLARDTLKFSTPYMASKIAVAAGGIWSGHVYGQLGEEALAAEMATLSWEFLLMGTAMGGLRAASIQTGQLRDHNTQTSIAMGNVSKTATTATLLYSLATLPILLKTDSIFSAMGIVHDPAVLDQVQDYFNGFVWGAPATLLLYADEQFALGLGETKLPLIYGSLYAGLAGLLASPLGDGAWGIPGMGTKGVGYAWSCGAVAGCLGLRLHMATCDRFKQYRLYDYTSLTSSAFKRFFRYAIPLALSNTVGLVQEWFFAQIITGSGRKIAQAYNASSAYYQQLKVFLLAYSSSSGALMAIKDTRKQETQDTYNEEKARFYNTKLGNATLLSSAVLATGFILPSIIWKDTFIEFFGGALPSDATTLAATFLGIQCTNFVISAFSNAAQANLYGLKDVTIPFGISLSSNVATLVTASIGAHTKSTITTALAPLVGNVLGCVGFLARWKNIDKGSAQKQEDTTLLQAFSPSPVDADEHTPSFQRPTSAHYTWKSAWGLFGLLSLMGF